MARIKNIELPGEKHTCIGLTAIYGIGRSLALTICADAKVEPTKTPVYSYTCPAGYTASGSGANTKCSKTETVTGYYCEDSEAKLTEDHKCVKTIKGEIDYYTCPADYTLTGTKCTKNSVVTIDATATTQSETTYQYKWSENSYLEGWTFTGQTKVVTKTYSAGQK